MAAPASTVSTILPGGALHQILEGRQLFTRGEILIIVAGLTIVVVGSGFLFDATVGRSMQKWAQSQGYQLVTWEWPFGAGRRLFNLFVNPTILFTVRDQAGNRKWGRARLVGLVSTPERVQVEWLDHHERGPESPAWRVIGIIAGVAALIMLADLLFG